MATTDDDALKVIKPRPLPPSPPPRAAPPPPSPARSTGRGFPIRLLLWALLATAGAGAGGYFAWTFREKATKSTADAKACTEGRDDAIKQAADDAEKTWGAKLDEATTNCDGCKSRFAERKPTAKTPRTPSQQVRITRLMPRRSSLTLNVRSSPRPRAPLGTRGRRPRSALARPRGRLRCARGGSGGVRGPGS